MSDARKTVKAELAYMTDGPTPILTIKGDIKAAMQDGGTIAHFEITEAQLLNLSKDGIEIYARREREKIR